MVMLENRESFNLMLVSLLLSFFSFFFLSFLTFFFFFSKDPDELGTVSDRERRSLEEQMDIEDGGLEDYPISTGLTTEQANKILARVSFFIVYFFFISFIFPGLPILSSSNSVDLCLFHFYSFFFLQGWSQ